MHSCIVVTVSHWIELDDSKLDLSRTQTSVLRLQSHIWRRWTWFSLVILTRKCVPNGKMLRCDAPLTWECQQSFNHRLHTIFVHKHEKKIICYDSSPTNLLTQLSMHSHMCRSVYIYDFENSIPYFYVHFSYLLVHLWQHHNLPQVFRAFAANTRFSGIYAARVSLFIHSFIGVLGSVAFYG